jgi:hypothetical protein
MAKKSKGKNPEKRVLRRVEKAQAKLEAAREIYEQERQRGQEEMERAQAKATRWVARATERIERREAELAEAMAEAAALGVQGVPVTEPATTVDRLQAIEAGVSGGHAADGRIVIAQSSGEIDDLRTPLEE